MNIRTIAQEIRNKVDMRTILSLYGYELDRHGFMRCPFHGEKTASFRAYEGTGGWHCFGCGKNGSVIDFVMLHEGCNFRDAVFAIDAALHLGLVDHHEDPMQARVNDRLQHQLDLFVDAVIAYCDALINLHTAEQDKAYHRVQEIEEKISKNITSVTAEEWTDVLKWDEDDHYTAYLIDRIREFEEEVLAWRRAKRATKIM